MRLIVLALLLAGCAFNPGNLSKEQKFKFQSCVVVYCEDSESSKVKKAGLKLLEITAAVNGGDLNLRRGFCEEYYDKRQMLNGWVWAKRSAFDICSSD